jgi:hypothetical protein
MAPRKSNSRLIILSREQKMNNGSFCVFEMAEILRTGAGAAEFESLISLDAYESAKEFADWLEANAEAITALMK